jgi:hypothetical protein
MKILKIVFLLISMVSVDLMSMEIDQSSKIDKSRIPVDVGPVTEIKSIQIVADGGRVFLLLNGRLYYALYDGTAFTTDIRELVTSKEIFSHIAITTNYFAADYKVLNDNGRQPYHLLIWDTAHNLTQTPYSHPAHNTSITGLYGASGNYFVSSSDFPNFKIWHITELKKSGIKEVDEMKFRYLLGVGSDHSILYATPRGFFKRWSWSDDLDIKQAMFHQSDKEKLSVGHTIDTLVQFTKDNIIKGFQFYYNDQASPIRYHVNGPGDIIVRLRTSETQDRESSNGFKALWVTGAQFPGNEEGLVGNQKIIYLQSNGIMMNKQFYSLVENADEKILDAFVRGTHIFYVTQKRSEIFVRMKNLEKLAAEKVAQEDQKYENQIMQSFDFAFSISFSGTDAERSKMQADIIKRVNDRAKNLAITPFEVCERVKLPNYLIKIVGDEAEATKKTRCEVANKYSLKGYLNTNDSCFKALVAYGENNANDTTVNMDWITRNFASYSVTDYNFTKKIQVARLPSKWSTFFAYKFSKTEILWFAEVEVNFLALSFLACPVKEIVKELEKDGATAWCKGISYADLVEYIDYIDRGEFVGGDKTDVKLNKQIVAWHRDNKVEWAIDGLLELRKNYFTAEQKNDVNVQDIITKLQELRVQDQSHQILID